jgi:hypothetical protein
MSEAAAPATAVSVVGFIGESGDDRLKELYRCEGF